jgi:archaellum component FlaG (FlaF/FlaG flagellin family)
MKTQEDDLLVYDEDEAVKFILNFIPVEDKKNIDDDKIQYVLDVVYDFYDENGLIDEDSTDEASIDEEEMFKFILKCSKKDKMELKEEEIQVILDGEFEYGKSLGIYRDDEEE